MKTKSTKNKTKKQVKKARKKTVKANPVRKAKTISRYVPKPSKSAVKQAIIKDMTFAEVMEKCPEAGFVMMNYGLHCIGCHVAAYETVEQGAKAHGLNEKQLNKMLDEMNRVAAKRKSA